MPAIDWGTDDSSTSLRPMMGMAPAGLKDLPGLLHTRRRATASFRLLRTIYSLVEAMTNAHLAAYGFSGGNGNTGGTALICVGYTTTALPFTYCVITGKARVF